MELGEKCGTGFLRKMDGRILVAPDFPEHGGFTGAVGTYQSHLFSGTDRKSHIFQEFLLEGQGISLLR